MANAEPKKRRSRGTGEHTSAGLIAPGTRVGENYRVTRVLGRGSMGIVYLAKDLALEREVAIKVLAPHYAADERVAKRFRREAVAMASVRNENVVQIYAFGDHEAQPFFVMEYVPGYTVAGLIEHANERSEQLYLDVVIGILAQVSRGLKAVHDASIVHRDVKPANMLVGPGFRVALTDFGLVEQVEPGATRDLAGTPLYLAPELIRRQEMPEEKRYLSDIYALGISTYEMLTGDVPFDGQTIKEILRRHVKQPAKPVTESRADLPAAVDAVVTRCLDKDPAARYQSCGDFMDALTSARQSGQSATLRSGRRILVVDDDPQILEIYTTALKVGLPHAAILTAEDGLSGFEMAKCSNPDLIVIDLDLPQMNGLELCAALTGNELTAEIPLIVVSANFSGDSRSVLRSLGIKELLLKPLEATQLVNVARRHLEGDD